MITQDREAMTQSIEEAAREIADNALAECRPKTSLAQRVFARPRLITMAMATLEAGEQRGIKLGREQAAEIAVAELERGRDNLKRSLLGNYIRGEINASMQIAQAIRSLL